MKTKPLSALDIPANFNLSAYDVCASWGLAEWCSAASDRNFLRMAFEMSARVDAGEPNDLRSVIRERSDLYFSNPLPENPTTSDPFDGHDSPVRDASAMDFFDGYFAVNDKRYDEYSNIAKQYFEEDWLSGESGTEKRLKSTPAWKMHREVGVRSEHFMVNIDLGASDELIVREFKNWLKVTRRATGSARIKPTFGRSDFDEWHEKRLLPYLDLSFWALARGGHFTLPVLADVLFPNVIHVGVEDRIRKVVAPDADFIVSTHMVSALAVQLAAEQKSA